MLAHLENALADWFHVAQISLRRLPQARQQAAMCQTILEGEEPIVELVGAFDRVHEMTVIEWLQTVNFPGYYTKTCGMSIA